MVDRHGAPVTDPDLRALLVQLLQDHQVTRETMAGYLRMSVRTWLLIERGQRELRRREMALLGAFFGVNPSVFFSAALLQEAATYAHTHRHAGARPPATPLRRPRPVGGKGDRR
jgi:transcriptional regulator with XRE-family HTH domain